jgi:drug/metabolite transporter (DMT)-like permease
VVVELIRRHTWQMLASGVLAIGAYGLVLTAARLGPIGLVAALRETSVVFEALAGWLILDERLGGRRTLAAIGVAVGGALLLAG